METENIDPKPRKGAHVLILLYPLQGHINPMLQFSKRLISKGLKVTAITSTSMSTQSIPSQTELEFVRIFDGFHEGEMVDDTNIKLDHFIVSVCQSLLELLDYYMQNKATLSPTPKMVIYDSLMPWVLNVLRKSGIQGAPFFTQSCMVNYIYYRAYVGSFKAPIDECLVSLPVIKESLRADDLPSFVSSTSIYPSFVRTVMDQFTNLEEVDYLLANTVDELEIEVVKMMASKWRVKTIGPTIPSMYLDRRMPNDKDYGLSFFKPDTKAYIPWLDAKESGSVVYASMGSLASLGNEQMEEMALGLESCNKYFVWVVRASEENKLPSNYKERTSEKGLIVNWCSQLEVLAHRSLGCFVTHAGWNSTLEAISLGVPMVAFPQWTDQPTNAKCIADFWKVGVRVKANEKGIVPRKEIEACVRQVMEGQRGDEIKQNVSKWKEVVKKAMEEGGGSDRNIEEIVATLLEPGCF